MRIASLEIGRIMQPNAMLVALARLLGEAWLGNMAEAELEEIMQRELRPFPAAMGSVCFWRPSLASVDAVFEKSASMQRQGRAAGIMSSTS
jgi:hypothetical protein